jgi:CDP-diacylglycerol--glycerol-3-phosphate 3-phosphatidyltransferase
MAEKTSSWFPESLELGKFWTIPNILSLSRFVIALPVAYLIVTDGPFEWIFGLTIVAIATDWIDGHLARWSRAVSEWGKIIDPVADKFTGVLVVGALVLQSRLPFWLIGLVAVRDIAILLGGLLLTRRIERVVMSTWLGKAAAAALALTVVLALLEADPLIMSWSIRLTAALLVLSFVRYVIRFFQLLRTSTVSSKESIREEPEASEIFRTDKRSQNRQSPLVSDGSPHSRCSPD